MPNIPLTHEKALNLVCSVCVNLRGTKPSRTVSEKVEHLVQKYVFAAYCKGSPYCPQGICNACLGLLMRKNEHVDGSTKKEVTFLLPESYHCELPHQTRKQAQEICFCRWCSLARLSGPDCGRKR